MPKQSLKIMLIVLENACDTNEIKLFLLYCCLMKEKMNALEIYFLIAVRS